MRSVELSKYLHISPTPIGVAKRALPMALVLACTVPSAHAAEHRYRPVHVTAQTATFAVADLAGSDLVWAHLDATGAKSHPVGVARIRRAARGARVLRVTLPRSMRPASKAQRRRLRLHVRTRQQPVARSAALRADRNLRLSTQTFGFGPALWKADAESTMASEWASSSSVPAAAAPPNPDPSRINQNTFRAQGQRSYRFEIRAGDDSYGARAELGQASPSRTGFENRWFRAGDDRWIAMQFYLPTSWPATDTWQNLLQIKPVSPGGGGPNIGLDAGGGKLKFYGNDNVWGSTAGKFFDGAGTLSAGAYALPHGRWIKLTWHVVFSADPAVGSVEVFGDLNGGGMRTLVPRRTRATMKYLNGAPDPAQLRVGIYRDPTMTATASMYVDGITVAADRAAAEGAAYAP